MGYIYFKDCSANLEKKRRKWAVMESRDELKLYKNYSNYYTHKDEYKKIPMKNVVMEMHRGWDQNRGYYIKMKAEPETIYEIWTETLREYELWINFFEIK